MIKINLIPPEYLQARAKKELQIVMTTILGVFVVVLMSFYFIKKAQAASLLTDISNAEIQLRSLQATREEIDRIQAEKQRLMAKRDAIVTLNKTRMLYPVFVDDFLPLLPSDVWFVDVKLISQSGLTLSYSINTKATSNYAVATLLTNLQQSSNFSNVKIGLISYQNGPSEGETTLTFNLTLTYTRNTPMPFAEVF